MEIRRAETLDDALLDALARLLVDCVDAGASVGFRHSVSLETAHAFWQRAAEAVAAGERAALVAEDEDGLLGTVHLILGLPENQPHRADVTKLLVHPRARRRGVGRALMLALEGV